MWSKLYLVVGVVGIAAVIAVIAYIEHLKGVSYESGYNQASVECHANMNRLKSSIERINQEALALKQRQMESYRMALDLRNKAYSEIDEELKQKLRELEEVQDEAAKDWYNTPIPDVYR